jgi:hypothetical protein
MVANILFFFRYFRPWLARTLSESKRVAELLSELPKEMNIDALIHGAEQAARAPHACTHTHTHTHTHTQGMYRQRRRHERTESCSERAYTHTRTDRHTHTVRLHAHIQEQGTHLPPT